MTEPVARVASPRRTVRVAAALVAGQATLCAVIGWVTFGSPQTGSAPPSAGRVAPLVVPPIVVPTESMALPTAVPSTSTAAARPKQSGRAPKPPVPVSKPKPRATTEAAPPPPPPPATMESPPPPSTTAARSSPAGTPPDLAATAPPSPPPTVQGPVVAGEPCDPVDALGRTVDDVKVRCVRGDDDRLRWEII